MGRKNKKRGSSEGGSGAGKPTMSQHNKRDVMEMVNTLLEKCSNPLGSGAQEWLDFIDIYELVEKIRHKQQAYVLKPTKRASHLEEFMTWLKDNGVDTEAVTMDNFDKEGWGLKAQRDIKMSELFLNVPRRVMMTTDSAKASKIGFLVEKDRILQGMPNVALSLHLLNERCSGTSFWNPYIKILPSSYTTPLYFTPQEIQLLKGSPVYNDVINQWRNIARQYAYFHTLFHTSPDAGKLPMKDFCFDDYRWAVSTVMTRQNQIPASEGERVVMALIPLWDMSNHCNGQITTDYNCVKDASESYALRTFIEGEQVFIYYGSRSNAELFMHSGFVYPGNQCDRVAVKLGVSKNDPLYSMKSELLARLAMLPSRLFYLHAGEDPVDSDLLAFLRVFTLDEDSLKDRLTGENASKLMGCLRDFGAAVSKETELKAWGFLATRISLLLRSYPTTAEEDGQELEKFDLPVNSRLATQLLRCEKRLLENAHRYATKNEVNVSAWPDLTRPAEIPETAFPATIEDVDEEMDRLELAAS